MSNIDPFEAWATWYAQWESRQLPIPWGSGKGLTSAERAVVGPSIAEFQLGESSDGRNFYRKVVRYAMKRRWPAYTHAIRDFIREENRHAALLGRLMEQEEIPQLKRSKTDGLFRLLRHCVPLRFSHRILLSAELIAVPYYRALSRASSSAVLKAICEQILADEARHIAFQSHVLQQMRSRWGLRRRLETVCTRIALELALDLVWWDHSDLLQRGGYGFGQLREETLEQYYWSVAMERGEIPLLSPQQVSGPSRYNSIEGRGAPSIS